MGIIEMSGLFGKKNSSGNVAKDRLKLVLIHDRINCSSEMLEKMRAEIVAVVSKYVDIEADDFSIEFSDVEYDAAGKKTPTLSANIPIRSVKKVK